MARTNLQTPRPQQVATPGSGARRPRARRSAPGVFPAKQQRAEQTRERLMLAGETLLETVAFDAVSIARIAQQADSSVGAFYHLFASKEDFFRYLLDGVVQRVQADTLAATAALGTAPLDGAAAVRHCVAHLIGQIRAHEGMMRTALLYTARGNESWQPIQELGFWMCQRYIDLIEHQRALPADPTYRDRLHTALQIVGGYLVNTVLNGSKLLGLHHPALEAWMCEIVLHCGGDRSLPTASGNLSGTRGAGPSGRTDFPAGRPPADRSST